MNWSALTKKQQQIVVGTLVLAVALFYVLANSLGLFQSSSSSSSAKEELADLQEKVENARTLVVRMPILQESLDQSVAELEEMARFIPTVSDRYAWVYEYISLRASQTGIELDSLEELVYSAAAGTAGEDSSYKISISTQCSYNQLVEFLWWIEQGNPLVRVIKTVVTPIPDHIGIHSVRIVLQWPGPLNIKRAAAK